MNDVAVAILISGFLTAIGWATTVRSTRRAQRRQHTHELLQKYIHDEKFKDAVATIGRLRRKGGLPKPEDPDTESERASIDFLLAHYEYLCSAVWTGDLDEELLKLTERSRIIKLFEVLFEYIDSWRITYDQPTLNKQHEDLCARWLWDTRTPLHRVLEYAHMKPYKEVPAGLRYLDRPFGR